MAGGQEAAIEAGIGPVALHGEASGFSVREQRNALGAGEAHRGGYGELAIALQIAGPRAKELELELLCSIGADGEIFSCLRGRKGECLAADWSKSRQRVRRARR